MALVGLVVLLHLEPAVVDIQGQRRVAAAAVWGNQHRIRCWLVLALLEVRGFPALVIIIYLVVLGLVAEVEVVDQELVGEGHLEEVPAGLLGLPGQQTQVVAVAVVQLQIRQAAQAAQGIA